MNLNSLNNNGFYVSYLSGVKTVRQRDTSRTSSHLFTSRHFFHIGFLFLVLQNDTMRIVWAFHTKEPVGGAVGPGSLPQHDVESRGTQSLYLVQRADQDAPGPEETARIWELRNPSVEPPTPGDTLYWCRVFRLPTLTRKHHLIRVSLITA